MQTEPGLGQGDGKKIKNSYTIDLEEVGEVFLEQKGGCSELLYKEDDKGDRGDGCGEQTGIH